MKRLLILISALHILFYGCFTDLPYDQPVTSTSMKLINQDNSEVQFGNLIKDKTTLIGFIFTNCPDICPMTVHNMHLIEQKLSGDDLKFIAVSFDPDRDTHEVLSKFARARNLNMDRWSLLTGIRDSIHTLMNEFGIRAFADDTVYTDAGKMRYYFIHTDKMALIDREGNFRKTYSGSAPDLDEIISDIKSIRN